MATASRFVKKYTRKPTSQVKDEFFISTDDVNQVSQFKEKIEKMHQIQISFENNTEEGQWLILEGEPVDRKNAKSYITAICNPAEKKQVQFSSSSCSELTDPTTLEYIEKTTNAFIRPLKKIAQFEISGTELAVTLALSQIEELAGTAVVGKDSDQCNVSGDDHDEHDGMIVISPNTHNASSRLSTVLQRALSANSDGICSAEDYSKVAPAVKRVLVNCLQDDEQDDIDDDLLFADGKQESGNTDNFKRSNIMMFYEGDDSPRKVDEKTTEQTSPGISSIAKKVTELTVSNPSETRLYTKQQKYLRSFGISTGFKETEVEKALCFVHENTRPSDFLDMLNSLQNKEEINVSHENDSDEVIILGTETINDDSDDDVIILETETVNLVTDERQVVDETLKTKNKEKIGNESKTGDTVRLPRAQSQNSLPDGYKERLLQDFFTEDENCSLDELKKRNAERQKLLRQNFESKQRNDANQSNAQAQTGKKQNKKARNKGKKNKHQQQQQQLQQKSVENEGMHDKQFRLDTSKNDKASKDDDQTCVLRVWSKDQGSTSSGVGQSSDEPPQTTPKRKGRNNQQQQQKSQLVSENDNNTGIKHDPNNSGSQGWAQWIQPVGRGNKPTQIVTPVNTPLTDFNNMASQAQVGQAREDLRYIVIDGSNVAMTHGNGKHFSCKGIKICVEYFRQRGHKNITVFVPQWRQYQPSVTNMILDQDILYELKQEDILVFTPSRKIGRKLVVAYDDRFVLELAEAEDGIIVSNDQYRDLMNEKAAWKKLIEERLLMYSFVRDRFMPPNDPLGREGPCLDDYLRVPKVSPFPRYWQGCNTSNELQQQHSHQQYSHQQQSQHCQQQNQHYQQNQLFQSQQNYMYHQQFPQARGHGHTHQGQGQFKSGQGHSQQIQPLFPMGKGNFAKAVIDENNQPFPKQTTGARNKTTVYRQFEAQHLNETENVPNGTKQDQWKNTTQKGQWSLRGKGIPRTDEETEELFKELRIMFPDDDQEEKIRSVLANHDRERDLTKLTNYLMSVLF